MVGTGKNSVHRDFPEIESRERTVRSRRRRRPTGLRWRHKQFLLPVAIVHYDFFALVSYTETDRVGGDCFNHFVHPFGHRLIVNRTHSLPVGLYYWSDVPIKKGSIVLFKLDQSTPLQQLGINRGYEARKLPLLKRVVALAGDVVSVSPSGVSINGQLLPNSAPLFDDEAGRPLTMAQLDHLKLSADQVFLMGVTPTSWDSRYFGPVPLSRCSGSFVPVLTWP